MIAGGLDTTPTCILLGLAILSGPQGQRLQRKMRDDISAIYPEGDAWEKCLQEEKVEYVTAFCKEVLRFWTVIPMSLPRVSIKDITYQGATIPAGTTFLMVCGPLESVVLTRLTFHAHWYRMPGLPILILSISNSRLTSRRNVSSTSQRDREPSIMPLGLGHACAQARILRIARCTSPFCASYSRSRFYRRKTQI